MPKLGNGPRKPASWPSTLSSKLYRFIFVVKDSYDDYHQYEFTWIDDDCHDPAVQNRIKRRTFAAMKAPGIFLRGSTVLDARPDFTADDLVVRCGPRVSVLV